MMKRPLVLLFLAAIAVPTSGQITHRISFQHPSDVPNNITIATDRQLGVDLDDGRLWRCEPTVTFCTAAEWKPVGQVEIQEEGASLPLRPAVNFIGTAVTCVDNPGSTRTDCTISGGPLVVKEDNVTVEGNAANLNFDLGFDITSSPAGQANVFLDLTEVAASSPFVRRVGDTMTGDLVMDDGVTDSPKLTLTPATGTTWSLFTADADDDFRLEVNTADTEQFELFNLGAGLLDVVIEGSLGVGGMTPLATLHVQGHMLLDHTSDMDDDHAFEIHERPGADPHPCPRLQPGLER